MGNLEPCQSTNRRNHPINNIRILPRWSWKTIRCCRTAWKRSQSSLLAYRDTADSYNRMRRRWANSKLATMFTRNTHFRIIYINEKLQFINYLDIIARQTGIVSGRIESATFKRALDFLSNRCGHLVPSLLGELGLLLRVNGQTRAGDRELDQEQHEQYDHVLSECEKNN